VSEINSWLEQHGGHSAYAYVILDNVSSGQTLYGSPLQSHIVFCDEWIGFVDLRLKEAQAILHRQFQNGQRAARKVKHSKSKNSTTSSGWIE